MVCGWLWSSLGVSCGATFVFSAQAASHRIGWSLKGLEACISKKYGALRDGGCHGRSVDLIILALPLLASCLGCLGIIALAFTDSRPRCPAEDCLYRGISIQLFQTNNSFSNFVKCLENGILGVALAKKNVLYHHASAPCISRNPIHPRPPQPIRLVDVHPNFPLPPPFLFLFLGCIRNSNSLH